MTTKGIRVDSRVSAARGNEFEDDVREGMQRRKRKLIYGVVTAVTGSRLYSVQWDSLPHGKTETLEHGIHCNQLKLETLLAGVDPQSPSAAAGMPAAIPIASVSTIPPRASGGVSAPRPPRPPPSTVTGPPPANAVTVGPPLPAALAPFNSPAAQGARAGASGGSQLAFVPAAPPAAPALAAVEPRHLSPREQRTVDMVIHGRAPTNAETGDPVDNNAMDQEEDDDPGGDDQLDDEDVMEALADAELQRTGVDATGAIAVMNQHRAVRSAAWGSVIEKLGEQVEVVISTTGQKVVWTVVAEAGNDDNFAVSEEVEREEEEDRSIATVTDTGAAPSTATSPPLFPNFQFDRDWCVSSHFFEILSLNVATILKYTDVAPLPPPSHSHSPEIIVGLSPACGSISTPATSINT